MGPFYPIVRPTDSDVDLTWVKGRDARAAGQVIEISGRVYDVKGNPLPGAPVAARGLDRIFEIHPGAGDVTLLGPHVLALLDEGTS